MQVIEQLRGTSDERFLEIYQALENQGFGPLDGEVAKAMKFRPHAIKKLPMAQRAKRARNILVRAGNAELCYELFGSYLMQKCKTLVTDFLDGTGVEHDDISTRPRQRQCSGQPGVAGADDGHIGPLGQYLKLDLRPWRCRPPIGFMPEIIGKNRTARTATLFHIACPRR